MGNEVSLLQIQNLSLAFLKQGQKLQALRSVSFDVAAGEILAIVGESGSGKSVTGLSIMKLHSAKVELAGSISYKGHELTKFSDDTMRGFRGSQIAMIFQEPMTALNPVFTIGYQLKEVLKLHRSFSDREATRVGIELLTQTGIAEPELRMKNYPFQLSGGMRQRVLIAMALAGHPSLLIADEPTTALDVTIQAQILQLLRDLNERLQMAIMIITHDLGIVAKLAHRVAVMYAGEIVEQGKVNDILKNPRHPYTKALLASLPASQNLKHNQKLHAISGQPPLISDVISGCAFRPRCEEALEVCSKPIALRSDESAAREWRCIFPQL